MILDKIRFGSMIEPGSRSHRRERAGPLRGAGGHEAEKAATSSSSTSPRSAPSARLYLAGSEAEFDSAAQAATQALQASPGCEGAFKDK
jgi:hypothetical protein